MSAYWELPDPWYLITLDIWSNFSSLTLGLSSARILLSQLSNIPLSLPLIFVIFHPPNPSLRSLIINAKLSLLCLELSPSSSPYCNITTAKVLNKVSLPFLEVSGWLIFSFQFWGIILNPINIDKSSFIQYMHFLIVIQPYINQIVFLFYPENNY